MVNKPSDPTRLAINPRTGASPLVAARNVDLDQTGGLHRRGGYAKKVAGSDAHSLFSDGISAVFVDGESMYQVFADYSTALIQAGLTVGARLSYWPFDEKIYYTNGSVIGWLERAGDGTLSDHRYADPGVTYKSAPPAGQILTIYNSRLYVAQGPVLWFSDTAAFGRFDLRKGFIQMEGEITLLFPVDDGLFIADGKTHFLAGSGGTNLTRVLVAEYDAIPGTTVPIDGKLLGLEGIDGTVGAWTSAQGVCIGASQGEYRNLTEKTYQMGHYRRGAGLFRQTQDYNQYVSIVTS